MEHPVSIDILLIEDDERLAGLTRQYLEQNGLTVEVESRGDRALTSFERSRPRLVLLDWMLPGKDGLSICRELRDVYAGPILMLTARDTDIDEVVGLEAGADDYVTKPADPMVLLARIRGLLRRFDNASQQRKAQSDIVLGGLKVSNSAQQVWLDGEQIPMTTQEFQLLYVLAKNAGTVLSREALFRETRGIDYDGLDRSIDGRVSRLRKKLGDNAESPQRIKTVWGKGYLLVPDAWGESP
ncbi:MAG: response regulator [Gammaproteobacteria bacterium]|nr:response regulator [Gammaproteobacteria bacterium]